ncbi:MAG: hypothetical protein L0Z62_34405 [Gemmataceae bacterium]|nr:hypothetical protein [Gemmataceae bacterium]
MTVGGQLRLWDREGEPVPLPKALAARPCLRVAFARDGKLLLTASGNAVSMWEWPSGRLLRSLTLPADGSEGSWTCGGLDLSADGRWLATLGQRHEEPAQGALQAYRTPEGTVDLWEVATGRHVLRLASTSSALPDLAFTPDGSGLLVADASLRLLDRSTGKVLRTFTPPAQGRPGEPRRRAVAWSPDGHILASAEGASVVLFEAASGRVCRRLKGHRADVTGLAFTPDGRRLVSAAADSTGLVWDVSPAALVTRNRP